MESSLPENNPNSESPEPRKRWYARLGNATLMVIVAVMVGGLIVAYALYKPYKIPTGSMEPTLLRGDHIITFGFFGNYVPERGDIVIFQFPLDKKKEFIKRIAGLPGEKIEMRKQQVFVNDQLLDESYAQHTLPPQPDTPRDNLAPFVIPDGQVFVLGDNRENSFDSRQFGTVEIKDISRKVKWIYLSWDAEEQAVRLDRIGQRVE